MKTINVGFIGAGDISLLHAEAIEACPGAKLTGLWNITNALAEEKSRIFSCKIYDSAEALVQDTTIDAVLVLTNLETHYQYTMLALEAGKHVFVEKPVGVSIEEIEGMRKLASQSNLICMPGHNYIYEPNVIRAKELLDSGKLGKLVSLYVLYNIHHPEEVAARYPGVIRQILTHHAYITIYLADKPLSVSAMKSVIHYEEITQEDLAMVIVQMQNGALAHLSASFASDDHAGDPWTMMIKVIGTKGSTRFSYRDWVENTPATVHSQTYSAYPYSILKADQYFIEECIGKGQKPLSSLDDAITALKMVEAVETSIAQEKQVVI